MSKESQLARQRSVADARLAAITAQLARWHILRIITIITTIATNIIVFVIILIIFVLVDITAQFWRFHNAHPQKNWKKDMQTTIKLLTFDPVNNIVLVSWSINDVEKVAKRPEKKRCKAEEKVDLPGRGDVKDFIVL